MENYERSKSIFYYDSHRQLNAARVTEISFVFDRSVSGEIPFGNVWGLRKSSKGDAFDHGMSKIPPFFGGSPPHRLEAQSCHQESHSSAYRGHSVD